jgi:hypothetical protein
VPFAATCPNRRHIFSSKAELDLMLFSRQVRRIILGLLAISAIGYGLKLSAQQSGRQTNTQSGGSGLTPPPAPSTPKTTTKITASTAPEGAPFVVGERLSFIVAWSNLPTAGRLEMEVAARGQFFGQESYQLRTRVETLGQLRSLFGEFDNQYVSYINPKNALPYRLVNSISQGQRQVEETIVVDQAKQQAIFLDDTTLALPAGAFDLTSLLYGLRLRALPDGDKFKLTVLYGKEVIELEAIVKTRERLTTQTGTYNTVMVKFYPQKKFSKYRGYVWLTDDTQRLPLMIKATMSIGEFRAELTSATVSTRPGAALAKLNGPADESGGVTLIPNGPPNGIEGGAYGKHSIVDQALPFIVGERLNYDVAWGNFTSVGRASFEVRQQGMLGNNRVFEFYGEAVSSGPTRALITVNDQLSSFALIDRLTPVRTDLRLREGRRIKQVSATYDWNKKSASLSTGTSVEIRPGTLDLVSLFYAVRASELKIGASYNYIFLDANYRLQMIVVNVAQQETIGGPLGTRDALKLDVFTPAPNQILLAQVYISNDARRLPLYLATRTRFGELRFQLTNTINTK